MQHLLINYINIECFVWYMREEIALVEVDARGRVQIPLPMRKALKIEPGDIIRIKVSLVADVENGESENPCQALAPEPIATLA